MNLQELLDYVNTIANKEQRGNTLKPTRYNSILQAVNIRLFNKRLGLPEDYVQQLPVPKMVWEATQKITDDLRRFKVHMGATSTMPLTVNTSGDATLPTNYVYPSSLRYKYVSGTVNKPGIAIEVLTDAQLGDRLASSIVMPTKKNPVCVFYNTYIKFYPNDLQFVDFTYLRLPNKPVYAYTVDANDNIIYDPDNSTDLEWGEENHTRIADMILREMGINLRDQELQQYAMLMSEKQA